MRPHPVSRDWGVSPFERLNIRTANFEHVPVFDGPILADAGHPPSGAHPSDTFGAPEITVIPSMTEAPALSVTSPLTVTSPIMVTPDVMEAPITTVHPVTAGPAIAAGPENSDQLAAAAGASLHAPELQRIVTIRVCAAGEMRWSGAQLTAALELHGLAFGRYHVFHRRHADGRSLFCVASLIEPGTFDVANMADQEFRGVSLFAVLPGPLSPLETMDELMGTARRLAEALSGMVQDAKGMPMSPQRAAALREDIARFQASPARH